jgi:hypothetical protein
MGRLKYLNPFLIRDTVRTGRRALATGLPQRVRVVDVAQPSGLVIPHVQLTIEVEGRDGHREQFHPQVPIPFLYAWAYRAARRLLPLGTMSR